MKQEIPRAPSAKEEPEFASRIQEVRGIAQGKHARQKSRKTRQGKNLRMKDGDLNSNSVSFKSKESIEGAGTSGSASRVHGAEAETPFSSRASCANEADASAWGANVGATSSAFNNRVEDSDGAVYGGFDKDDMVQSWDELFGLVDKEQEKPSSNIRFLDALRDFKESGFARVDIGNDRGRRLSAAKPKRCTTSQDEMDLDARPDNTVDWGIGIDEENAFGFAANKSGQRRMGNETPKDNERNMCKEKRQDRQHSSSQHPTPRVRPPQKRKRVYVTQQASGQGMRISKLVAISASTSLLVSVAVALATGAIGPEVALAGIAGWSM